MSKVLMAKEVVEGLKQLAEDIGTKYEHEVVITAIRIIEEDIEEHGRDFSVGELEEAAEVIEPKAYRLKGGYYGY